MESIILKEKEKNHVVPFRMNSIWEYKNPHSGGWEASKIVKVSTTQDKC